MDSGRDAPWRDEFVLARDFRQHGDHSTIYRAVEKGALTRVTTGAYLPAARWSRLDADQRRLALIDANALVHPGDGPYCHLSAACLWALPRVGTWPGDFWWPETGLVGEFDGRGKYLRDEFTRGRTTAEVVLDEKRRENRLRALGLTVVRWEWADALMPRRLEMILTGVGLRRVVASGAGFPHL
jgi:hypothetical protein